MGNDGGIIVEPLCVACVVNDDANLMLMMTMTMIDAIKESNELMINRFSIFHSVVVEGCEVDFDWPHSAHAIQTHSHSH